MRRICLLAAGAALAGCSTAPQPTRTAAAEAHFQKLVGGKVAGTAVSCIPRLRANNMVVIDDSLIAFRDGSRRVYVNDFRGGRCSRLGSGFYALVTRSFGSSGLCSGDIAEVVDTNSGVSFGNCVLGDFIPYTRAGA